MEADSSSALSATALSVLTFLLIFCLAGSAICSGGEVALFSLKGMERRLKGSRRRLRTLIRMARSQPEMLLAAILIGNNLFNIAIVLLSVPLVSAFLSDVWGSSELVEALASLFVSFVVIFAFGELVPKTLAARYPLAFLYLVGMPLYWLVMVLRVPGRWLVRLADRLLEVVAGRQSPSLSLLRELVVALKGDVLDEVETHILQNLLELSVREVRYVMRPRQAVPSVPLTATSEEVISLVKETRCRRLLVYRENVDDVVGVVSARDLLQRYLLDEQSPWTVYVRDTLFVPENMQLDELLSLFQRKKQKFAVVVDVDYGSVVGVVALEDILNELVGPLAHETRGEKPFRWIVPEKELLAGGTLHLTDLEELFDLPAGYFTELAPDSETLAGLLLEQAERLPEVNSSIFVKDFEFTVLKVSDRAIEQVRVRRLSQRPDLNR